MTLTEVLQTPQERQYRFGSEGRNRRAPKSFWVPRDDAVTTGGARGSDCDRIFEIRKPHLQRIPKDNADDCGYSKSGLFPRSSKFIT